MQGIFRRLASTGLAGMAIVSSALLAAPAWALSEQQILEKLGQIPVFLIVNPEGQSLTASVNIDEETELEVPIVFVDSQEAESFLAEAENEGEALADDAQIAILPLSDVYAEASEQLESAESLVYVPSARSLSQATQIVDQEIQGVPLYAAVDLESNQYLLTSDNTLPMFFSLNDLQSQVSLLIEANPEVAESIGVEVTTFETILQSMSAEDAEADQLLELIRFVPSSQTLEYLRNLSGEAAPAESSGQ